MRKDEVEALLREACCRYMWRAVPGDLESEIVDAAMRTIPDADMNASPFGELIILAAEIVKGAQGEGAFVTVYDEVVAISEASLDDVCIEPGTEAFEQMRRLGYRKKV
jgi:hypothetical protein